MDKQKLLALGVNYDEGLKRFAGNEKLYAKFLGKFEADQSFKMLQEALDQKKYEDAFKAAHTLKGVAGNLSLNILYQKIQPVVEGLRNGVDIPGAIAAFPEVAESYEAIVAGLKGVND